VVYSVVLLFIGLFRQLGTYLGVCTGQVRPDEYWVYIKKIRQLLDGLDTVVVKELSNIMDTAIENLQFEKAAKYREYYLGLRHVIEKQRLVQLSNKNRNILAVEFLDATLAKLFLIKGNKLLYGKVFNRKAFNSIEMRQSLNKMIRDEFVSAKNNLPKLTERDIDEAQIIFSYLKKNRKRVLSFWIPSTRLKNEASLDAIVIKIINRITII